MTDYLDIPQFLRRPQTNGDTMLTDHPFPLIATKSPRKPREKVELPTSIELPEGELLLEAMTREQILQYIEMWEKLLQNVPKVELELRSLKAEMKRRLK
jgi:hypothetical protein